MLKISARKSITKRGIEHDLIVYIVIGIVVMVIILVFAARWKASTDYLLKKELCRQSVYFHSISKIHREYIRLSPDIRCQTNYFTLDYDPATEAGQKMIKKEIADLMADTWEVFGQGKLDLFTGDGKYCVIYSVIDFNEKYGDKKVKGLTEFLMSEKIPGKQVTYMDYLQARTESNSLKLLEEIKKQAQEKQINLGNEEIDTSKKYATIFIYAKGRDYVTETFNALDNFASSYGFKVFMAGGVTLMASGLVADMTVVGISVGIPLKIIGGTMFTAGGLMAALEQWLGTKEEIQQAALVIFREYNKAELDKLNCTDFPVIQEYRPK